jgi:hypothetical protein
MKKLLFLSLILLNFGCCEIAKSPCSTELFIEIRKVDTTCETVDGQIIVQVSGGKASYKYEWKHDASLTSNNIDQLNRGLYQVVISDSEGRQSVSQIIIN